MKTRIIYLLLLIVPASVNAQILTDLFGMPSESSYVPSSEVRFVGDDMPVTTVMPTLAFPSPTPMPSGIAWDGTYLWVCGYNEFRLFCVDPLTGDTVKTIPLNILRPYGVSYKDSALYVLDTEHKRVVRLDYSGTVSDTINLLDFGNVIFPTGLYVCNERIWFNDTKGSGAGFPGDSTLYISDHLSGYSAYADFPSGIACDGQYLWVTDNASQTTSKIETNDFSLIERFTAPGGAYPNGLAWGDNGLWYVNNASDSIYFVPHTTTNSNEIFTEAKTLFYPNPASDVLYFSSDDFSGIEIIDFAGRVVMESQNSIPLDISGLKNGVYMVRINNKNSRLVISR